MEQKLTRNELKTLFYVGRKLELVHSLLGPTSQLRTVKAQRSYGYEMQKPDGRVSRLDLVSNEQIFGCGDNAGLGYTSIKFYLAGELAAQYKLL